jgi:hypothetical protein
LKERKQAALFVFNHSCPPIANIHLTGDPRDGCYQFNSKIFAFVAASPQIKNVALLSIWRQGYEGILTDRPGKSLTQEQSRQLFRRRLAETIRLLKAADKSIYLFEPVPGTNGSAPIGMARRLESLEMSLNDYNQTYEDLFATIREHREYLAGVFSPSKAICVKTCSISMNGAPLYFDNNHMTKSSATFWAKRIGEQLGY